MKRILQFAVAFLLLASITLEAEPLKTWTWIGPTTYVNGDPIPASDTLSHRLYCGTTAGGPYPNSEVFATVSPATQDMVYAVMGQPGDYFCVSTALSSLHGSESGFSNEENFIVTPADLGFVPNAPVLTILP